MDAVAPAACMAEVLKEIVFYLKIISGSLTSIATCMWLMLLCKDMGHSAANAIRNWRMNK